MELFFHPPVGLNKVERMGQLTALNDGKGWLSLVVELVFLAGIQPFCIERHDRHHRRLVAVAVVAQSWVVWKTLIGMSTLVIHLMTTVFSRTLYCRRMPVHFVHKQICYPLVNARGSLHVKEVERCSRCVTVHVYRQYEYE